MAGKGPAPKAKATRRNKTAPVRGEIVSASSAGWQHGPVPAAPDGLMPASVVAWSTWLGAWFAAFWTPDDLPALRQIVRLYDQVERGEYQRASELRLQMDTYGITPKGQQDRRWSKPKEPDVLPAPGGAPLKPSAYGHLRSIG
jgi:hypothetical protein